MSVLSGERTIFCEGRKNSLDYKLLSRVGEGITGDKYTIIPAGSKFTFSIFAQGYFFPDEVTNQKYTDWIETSARHIQPYQAVRWALGDLLRISTAREQLKTTWTGGSGRLPKSLDLQDCRNQALKLIKQFRQAVKAVTPEEFETSLNSYQQQFTQRNFWTQQQYLIWFHGKDLQREMQRQKPDYISLSSFFDWAIDQFDINQYPDLMELRARIEQL